MQKQIPNFTLATKNQRMLHFITDNIVVSMLITSAVHIIDFVCLGNQGRIANFLYSLTNIEYFIMVAPVHFLYYFIFEYFYGKTIAKLLTKTMVVNVVGKKPTLYAVLTRSLLRVLPLEFITFLTEKHGWHDKYSQTVVVNAEKLNDFIRNNA